MRIDALHNLAIELEHKTQYAVRRRVLRSEIDGEVARRSLTHGGPRFVLDTSVGSFSPSGRGLES